MRPGEPFISRDLTRDDLRAIVSRGLELSNGSYKALLKTFNMPAEDTKKFLSFLRKYQSHVPVPQLRSAQAHLSDSVSAARRVVNE